MYRAEDKERDQSYFLFSTTQSQLDYLRFPLGLINKSETRNIANKLNLNVATKPDSQDICFVPNGNYASVIERYRPQSFQKGDIFNIKGEKLGTHDGIINYTIGQRKGIKISNPDPLYVIDIKAKDNSIVVGTQDFLNIKKLFLRDINLLADTKNFEKKVLIKVRSTGKLLDAKVTIKNNSAEVEILQDEKEADIAATIQASIGRGNWRQRVGKEGQNDGVGGETGSSYVPPHLRGKGGGEGVPLPQRESSSSGRFRDEGYTLRVSSIGDEAKEADIMDLFREFGRVLRCYVAKDRVTMESRGFAFVTFSRKEDADRALKTMDGRPYGYMVLHVEYARPSKRKEQSLNSTFRSGYGKALTQGLGDSKKKK